jgi:hypothetical protein
MKTHSPFPKIHRTNSLHHKLRTAKDAKGNPTPLIDELLFFLDYPPDDIGDRWQKGADLCASYGIETSRMSVYRFHRANILQWRREQNPPPPADPVETKRMQEQAEHLAAQRVLDALSDPDLSPGHLICLLQSENHRRRLQLDQAKLQDALNIRKEIIFHEARRKEELRLDRERSAIEFNLLAQKLAQPAADERPMFKIRPKSTPPNPTPITTAPSPSIPPHTTS